MKIICIDTSTLVFPAIFNWERQVKSNIESKSDRFIMPPHAVYFTSLISCLKKIHVEKDDIVILTQEGSSWRKKFDGNYKSQRAGDREKHTLIDWDKTFALFNKLHRQLDEATDWHILREWNSESDDLCAIVPKVFKDKECIIVTGDRDLWQLAHWPNVKIFNVNQKCKGSKGMYQLVENPLDIIAKKVKNGDISDNILVDKENDTPNDVELRKLIIDLLNMPDFVENPIREILENLPKKELHLDKLPNFKNCKEKFMEIYNPKHKIEPEYCYNLLNKRINQKKKAKKKEKK